MYGDAWDEVTTFPEVEHDDQADAFVYALKAWEAFCRTRAERVEAKSKLRLGPVGGWQKQVGVELKRLGKRKGKGDSGPVDVTGLY